MNKEINSIGLNKKPSDTKIVVAMSGGVDSSTVAGMMDSNKKLIKKLRFVAREKQRQI